MAFLVAFVASMAWPEHPPLKVEFLDATREDGRTVWHECTLLPVPEKDRSLVRREIEWAMGEYPKAMIEENTRGGVYAASDIVYEGVGIGGLNWVETQTLLVGANVDPAADPHRAEYSFHHELSHILVDRNRLVFPEKEWRAINPPKFRYLEREGLDTLREGITEAPLEPALRDGFAEPYGRTNLHEDVAMVAETLMSDDRNVLNRLASYPRLERKCRLLIRFYQRLDPTFRPPSGWDRAVESGLLHVGRCATTSTPAV